MERGDITEDISLDDSNGEAEDQENFKDMYDSFGKDLNNGTGEDFDAVEISEDTNADLNILGIIGGNVKSNKTITKVKEKEHAFTNETINKIVADLKEADDDKGMCQTYS